MKKEPIWTKNFILTTLAGFFAALVFYISLTTFAVYAAGTFELSESLAGFAASSFLIGSVIGRVFSGRYLELMGRGRVVLIGGAVFIALTAAYLIPVGFAVFIVLRILHGIVFGAVQNAFQTIVINFLPQSRLGEGLGFFSLNFILAAGIGPFIGLYIIRTYSYTALFWLCIVFAVLALVVSFFIRIVMPEFTDEQMRAWRKPFALNDVFDRAALPMACMAILVGACYTSVTAFLETYSNVIGLTAFAPFYFLIVTAVVVIVRPVAGRLLDRRGENIVMLPSLICFVLSLAALAFAQSIVLLIASAVLLALGFGNVLIMGQTIAAKSVPAHRTSRANATYFSFSDAGYGIGPLLFGIVATGQGFSFMYAAGACVMIGTVVLYYLAHGRRPFKKYMRR